MEVEGGGGVIGECDLARIGVGILVEEAVRRGGILDVKVFVHLKESNIINRTSLFRTSKCSRSFFANHPSEMSFYNNHSNSNFYKKKDKYYRKV